MPSLMHLTTPAVVGEMRGELLPTLVDEIRIPTGEECPFCSGELYRIEGYTARVIIKRIVAPGLAEIEDIPESHKILSCKGCRRQFSEVGLA